MYKYEFGVQDQDREHNKIKKEMIDEYQPISM